MVAALSPAVFSTYEDAHAANTAAFDSPANFARNNVFSGLHALRHVPAYVACGTDDPFAPERPWCGPGWRLSPGVRSRRDHARVPRLRFLGAALAHRPAAHEHAPRRSGRWPLARFLSRRALARRLRRPAA
jgi:hypothetical protein